MRLHFIHEDNPFWIGVFVCSALASVRARELDLLEVKPIVNLSSMIEAS